METIQPIKIEKKKAIVEIYGETHTIKNPKHGQILEFYGQKYKLDLKSGGEQQNDESTSRN